MAKTIFTDFVVSELCGLIVILSFFSLPTFAQTLVQCGQITNGSINVPTEQDRYTFNASAGDTVILQLAETSRNFNATMELRGPGDQLITSGPSQITRTLTQAGVHTVVVKSVSATSASTGNYQLFLQRIKNPCNATQLTECRSVNASLSSPAELGAYVFDGVAGQTAVVWIGGTSINFNAKMTLYDPDGTALVSSNSNITRTLTKTGVYTVMVSSNTAGVAGTYTLNFGNVKINLLSPVGGEVFLAGSPMNIAWDSNGGTPNLASHDIQLSTDGGATFPTVIASGLPASARSYVWNVPATLFAANARVRVIARDSAGNSCSDISGAAFSVAGLQTADPTIYRYDKLNRLTQVVYVDGTAITYTYDEVGNRLSEVVSPVPIFKISSTPTLINATPAASINDTATVTSLNGFNSPVSLSCSGLPAGVTCNFTPVSVTSPPNGTVSSTLRLNIASSAPLGIYSFQVVGTGGNFTRTSNVVLAVRDFNTACPPVSLRVGGSASSVCSVSSLNGFNSPVNLSCSSLPAGVTCNFSQSPATPQADSTINSTLTVNAAPSVPPGSYPIQVVGTSGSRTRTANVSLTVLASLGPVLIWQHQTSGLIGEWLMNGTTMTQAPLLTPSQVSDTNWKIVGTGDFNGDSKPDLVWQHQANGQIGAWLMDGTTMIQAPLFNPSQVADTRWKIVAVGDFNSDGKSDLVWQHQTSGEIGVWLMNGTSLTQAPFFTPNQVSDTNWKIVGAADFNSDSKPDLVWQHQTTGQIGVWLMNGTSLTQSQFFTPSPVSDTNWKIVGAGDFNNDAKPDLVWRHQANGQIGVWLMNGTTMTEAPLFTPSQVSDTNWKIVGVQ